MGRALRRPAEIVNQIVAPLLNRKIEIANGVTIPIPGSVLNRVVGDCDEGSVLAAGGPPILGIDTALRFGGHIDGDTGEPGVHHVWAVGWVEGSVNPNSGDCWWDMDVTIPELKLGEFAPFPVYAKAFPFGDPTLT